MSSLKLFTQWASLKARQRELEAEAENARRNAQQLEEALLRAVEETGESSVKTNYGTVYLKRGVFLRKKMSDDALLGLAEIDPGLKGFVKKTLDERALAKFMDDHPDLAREFPQGLEVGERFTVILRTTGGNGEAQNE